MIPIAYYLIIIFLPLTIIFSNFLSLVTNFNFYQKIYEKEGIYSNFSQKEIANAATDNLFGYFRANIMLEQNFFSPQARLHLKDVKILISNVELLNIISVLVLSACAIFIVKKELTLLKKSVFFGSLLTISFVLLLSIFSTLDFSFFFEKFHILFFSNNLWVFSTDDNLIKLFPESFFQAFAQALFLNIIITATLLLLASSIFPKKL